MRSRPDPLLSMLSDWLVWVALVALVVWLSHSGVAEIIWFLSFNFTDNHTDT